MKEKYTKENLAKLVSVSKSIAEVIRHLKKQNETSKPETIRKYIKLYGLDTSHFTGQRWNKGQTLDQNSCIPLEDILKPNVNYRSDRLKKRLVEKGILEYKCAICNNSGEWNGKPIVLELHHINGNHFDNTLENLQILCPNCHSQCEGHRKRGKKNTGKTLKKVYKKICIACGKEFQADRKNRSFCSRHCYNNYYKKDVQIISEEALKLQCKTCKTITELSKKFNTSRPTIRKYLIKYNLFDEFTSKYDFHSKAVVQYDLSGKIIKEWPSISDAEQTLNIKSIDRVLCGKRRSAGGFFWKYKD